MVYCKAKLFTVLLLSGCWSYQAQASLHRNTVAQKVELVKNGKDNTLQKATEIVPHAGSNETYNNGTVRSGPNKTKMKPENSTCSKEKRFRQGAESFLNYLLQMQSCDALNGTHERMEEICASRKFAYTEYYKVAYLRFCEDELYRVLCRQDNVASRSSSRLLTLASPSTSDESDRLPIKIFGDNDQEEMIKQACKSVEDFSASLAKHEVYSNIGKNVSNVHYSNFDAAGSVTDSDTKIPVVVYSEWYFPIIPFCKPFTCGISYEEYFRKKISAYHCMPQYCKTMVVFSVVFDAILAVLTIVANSLVLGVAARTKIMRNIPGYFKISLALADLAVGVFVLPSCIFTTYIMYIGPLPFRYPGQRPSLTDYISRPLANFIGFFVVLSFAVSIYTMAVASIDRYLAITKPFQYRQGKYLTKKRCVLAFALIWFIGFAVAIYPVFTTEPYGLSAFNLILSAGVSSSIVYAVALFVPLLAVWSLNGAMLKQVCADREKRSSIRASTVINSGSPQHFTKRDNTFFELPLPQNSEAPQNASVKPPEIKTKEGQNGCADDVTPPQKKEVTRNISTSSVGYHKNEKRSSGPVGEGIIERMKRKRSKKMENVFQRRPISRRPSIPSSAASVERRLARTLAIMIGAFTVALMPNIATMIAYVVLSGDNSPATLERLASTFYIASRILLSNSFWNCIIYSIRNRHFRRAMWAIFLCEKEKIDRKLRQSLNMSQWKRRSAMGSCSGSSVHDKRSLSKSNSTSSTAASYQNKEHRRSTTMWSLSSTSPCPSRKGSCSVLKPDKNPVERSLSCDEAGKKQGILKKPIERCESAPARHEPKFIIPTVTVDTIDENAMPVES